MKNPLSNIPEADLAPTELPKEQSVDTKPAPVAWQEFLEEDADCCGGCNHKPR